MSLKNLKLRNECNPTSLWILQLDVGYLITPCHTATALAVLLQQTCSSQWKGSLMKKCFLLFRSASFPIIYGTWTKVLKYIAKTTQLSQKPGNCKCSVVRSAMTYYIGVSARLMSTPVSNRTLWGGSGLETTVKYTQGCHTSLRSWANIGYSSEKCDLNLEKHHEAVTGPTFLKRIKYRTCSQHCAADRNIRCWIWGSDFYFVAWKILRSLQTPFPQTLMRHKLSGHLPAIPMLWPSEP